MTDKQDPIAHAARLLREAAEELRQAHTYHRSEGWQGETGAQSAYDVYMAAAQALEDWEAAVGAGGVQPLRNTTPDQVQKPVAYAVFAENGNIRLWSQQPVDIPRIVPLYSAPQPLPAEVLGWIYEDELPQGYPYEAMNVRSRVDGVRLFPVFGPHAAPLPASAPLSDDAKDAARYRFLAGHCRSTSEHWGGRWSIVVDGPAPKSHDSEDDFDDAVDAAIAAQGAK